MGRVSVVRSTVIDAPLARVWELVRDFNGFDRWLPMLAESRLEDGRSADQVGCVRGLRLQDGAALREQLLSLSDRDHRLVYCLYETPIPLINYVAEIELKPVTDEDHTFWRWQARFDTPPGQERALERLIVENVFEAGFAQARGLIAA
jgi:uncharacterized protein YndB with AHSA1/START domain